jgi:hypothetical protein
MAVRVWVILSEILKTVKLSRETDHDLSTYIVLMEQTFNNCMSAMIDEASNNDDMKKIKIPQVEEKRGYCQDGAKKPKHPYNTCPKCQAPFVHEPPETVAIREGNKVKTKAWKNLNHMLEQFNAGLINNPPTDANGKPYTKQIDLKLGEVTYYCKAYTMKHTHGVGGYKCADCNDRTCALCTNMCRHAFTERYVVCNSSLHHLQSHSQLIINL